MKRENLPLHLIKGSVFGPEVCKDEVLLDAITKDVKDLLGWENLLGSTRSNLKLLLPIIQKHMEKK